MTKKTTITVRLDSEINADLDSLSEATRRSKAFLVAEAVGSYVKREKAIMEGIERGIEDMNAGRVIPHEQVMKDVGEIIDQWGQNKS